MIEILTLLVFQVRIYHFIESFKQNISLSSCRMTEVERSWRGEVKCMKEGLIYYPKDIEPIKDICLSELFVKEGLGFKSEVTEFIQNMPISQLLIKTTFIFI